ncbi:MAG TPA: hypothetical protein VJ924_02200 [Alphaproteobacteria bacterium]|nr:hypothetical protein [Alphaproteobacteria bacterium]
MNESALSVVAGKIETEETGPGGRLLATGEEPLEGVNDFCATARLHAIANGSKMERADEIAARDAPAPNHRLVQRGFRPPASIPKFADSGSGGGI